MRYFGRVEYDGTVFCGWQVQPNGVSVQQKLNEAFSTILREDIKVTGSGRTDAGVHARGQAFHFDTSKVIDVYKVEKSLNGILPNEIAVYSLKEVNKNFHSRYDAVKRVYKYYIVRRKTPLLNKRAWFVPYMFDIDAFVENLHHLEGSYDFSAFCASNSTTDNMNCTIFTTKCELINDVIVVTIEGNRFLYKMVRSVIGTLVEIARGKITDSVKNIILSKDRKLVGETAPPWGLVLDWVEYPEE